MERLPRLQFRTALFMPPLENPELRVMSPIPGYSTFMTSAPSSANNIVATGPATTCVKSTILIPSNGPITYLSA